MKECSNIDKMSKSITRLNIILHKLIELNIFDEYEFIETYLSEHFPWHKLLSTIIFETNSFIKQYFQSRSNDFVVNMSKISSLLYLNIFHMSYRNNLKINIID